MDELWPPGKQRLARARASALELLHLTGSFYVIASAVFNLAVQRMGPILLFSVVSGFFGFVAFLMFHGRQIDELVRFLSVSAVVGGLVVTFWAFYVGLELKGVEGPGWVIFLLIVWELWRLPASALRKRAARRRFGWKAVGVGVVLLMVLGSGGAVAYSMLRVLHPFWWAAILYVVLVFLGLVLILRKS